MKRFVLQLLYFTIPIIILFIFFLVPYPILDDEILNNELEYKISVLKIDTTKINIIIAGDSRAERQLIPEIIKENTGFNVINIATIGCDLVTLSSAIKKRYRNYPKIIFVISASSWQINDGAIDLGYLSLKCFQKFNIKEKLLIYRNDFPEMLRMQLSLFKEYMRKVSENENDSVSSSNTIKELGYTSIDGKFNFEPENVVKANLVYHPWYKNVNNNGYRWSIFQESLNEMEKATSGFYIIYQPPISSYWRTNTAETFVDKAENEYSKKVETEIKNLKNIEFLDFYSHEICELNDSMYYDYQHLNQQGAEIFSKLLSKKILTEYQKHLVGNN